jgi:hypothetical protein
MKYPEIYNIEDIEVWKQTYMRKEILTNEWDLICHEVSTDVFEIPTLTNEFCDKFVEDNKEVEGESIMLWGNSCDDVKYPSNFDEIMVGIIRDNVINALHHLWTIDVPSFQKMTLDNHLVRFNKNQDLRVRHDSCLITCYMKMDSDSTGGELFFPKYDFTLKPKQGHLYFFPGRLTHRYGINLIKSGVNNSLFIYFMDK